MTILKHKLIAMLLLAGTAALCVQPAAADTVYRWVDANGVTHFSDKAPANVKAQAMQIETPAPAPNPEKDYYSVVNQERRMAKSLAELNQQADREWALKIAAEKASQPAETPAPESESQPETVYVYPPYRPGHFRHRHHHAHRAHVFKPLPLTPEQWVLQTPEGRPELNIPPPGAPRGGGG